MSKTAIIVVDMTNDFAAPGGMFDRAGRDISIVRRVIPAIAAVLDSGRRSGIPVIYLTMGFQPDLSDLGIRDSPNWRDHTLDSVGKKVRSPTGAVGRIGIRGMWNTEVIEELRPQTSDIVMYKNRFSGFYKTDLDDTLKRLGSRYLVVTGCTTSVCVESTIRDATFRDYSPILLADCTAEPIGHALSRSNHDASLLLVELVFGWVASSRDLIAALAQRRA